MGGDAGTDDVGAGDQHNREVSDAEKVLARITG
jgi:hypothetical protein